MAWNICKKQNATNIKLGVDIICHTSLDIDIMCAYYFSEVFKVLHDIFNEFNEHNIRNYDFELK